MAHFALTGCKILLGPYDLASDMNAVTVQRTADPMNNTTFGNAFMQRSSGQQDAAISMAGLIELTDDGQDEILENYINLIDTEFLVSLIGAADGDRCKFGQIMETQYQPGGDVGGIASWSANGLLNNQVWMDGLIMSAGVKTGTFNGTARQLGAVAAGQKIYAQLYALAPVVFTDAVFKLQSDDNSGFTSATDRITFSTVTGLSSQQQSLAGAITDDYWRIVCSSFTGTSLQIYAAVGIY